MSDLISRSKLREEAESLRVTITGLRSGKGILADYMKQYRESFLRMIDEQPEVEAAEVVHGRWENTDGYDEWECSECKHLICGYDDDPADGEMKFCSMCGADMRKKV